MDPPFNTGRSQKRSKETTRRNDEGDRIGFKGKRYVTVRSQVLSYDDQLVDYWESHYAKVLLDSLFGPDCFLNKIIWSYDSGGKSKSRWPAKHDTIQVFVKDP